VEVVNDDYEQNARNTTSTLEDMESKYSMALERNVLLEEEMKAGEQEREALRVNSQRLRDELSDLQVETEILQEKLRQAERKPRRRNTPDSSVTHSLVIGPRISEITSATESTPSACKSQMPASAASTIVSEVVTPPSPTSVTHTTATSETSDIHIPPPKRLSSRGSNLLASTLRKMPSRSGLADRAFLTDDKSIMPRVSAPRESSINVKRHGHLTRSASLYQVRGLLGKMQKLEERVNAAKSRLPAIPSGPSPQPALEDAELELSDNPRLSDVCSNTTTTSGIDHMVQHPTVTPSINHQLKPPPNRASLNTKDGVTSRANHDISPVMRRRPSYATRQAVGSHAIESEVNTEAQKQLPVITTRTGRQSIGGASAKPPRASLEGSLQLGSTRAANTILAPRRVTEERNTAARLPTTRSPVRRQSRVEVRGPPALGVSLMRRSELAPRSPPKKGIKPERRGTTQGDAASDGIDDMF